MISQSATERYFVGREREDSGCTYGKAVVHEDAAPDSRGGRRACLPVASSKNPLEMGIVASSKNPLEIDGRFCMQEGGCEWCNLELT